MTGDNYINLKGNEMRLVRVPSNLSDPFLQLFKTRRNVLVRPQLWGDPFENFILNAQARLPTNQVVTFGFNNDFYGQCWTLHTASDAMWRIYSPNSSGGSHPNHSAPTGQSLADTLGQWAHVQCFIGKVQYLTINELCISVITFLQMGLVQSRLPKRFS